MIKPEKDAFGQEIWAHYNGERSVEIVEVETGYIDASSGPPAYFSEYKDWPKHWKRAIKFVKGRTIDIGAGAGRVSLYLQDKEYNILAIDNSPLAIKVCKLRGVKKTKVISITEINSKLGKFDTILMLGNNFGLFGNYKRAKWLLKRFHSITNPDVRIIAESNDPYNTTNRDHLEYHKLNRKRGKMSGQIKIRIRHKKTIGNWFEYLLVSKKEMADILRGTGWKTSQY
ncbi:MAG: class I SAM-dependent methyltransferase, partial [candidate division Zixibacteria bacterium]|nr:class I SAM-dependent methyltransferase [candidate division Zixibacteria bacterium]